MPSERGSSPDERRKRILDASLKEFVDRGFDGASTNAIAKQARVAKGLLFHYFGNKAGLYGALLDDAVGQLTEELQRSKESQPTSSDLIDKIVTWSRHKLRLFQANPQLYQFVTAAFANPPDVLRQEIESKRDKIEKENWNHFFAELDTSKFRSDLSTEQAIEILQLFVSGLEAKYMGELAALPEMGIDQLERMVEEMHRYLLVLRDGLYRG